MKHACLEVTYRKGRPVAANYYLPQRDGDRSTWVCGFLAPSLLAPKWTFRAAAALRPIHAYGGP